MYFITSSWKSNWQPWDVISLILLSCRSDVSESREIMKHHTAKKNAVKRKKILTDSEHICILTLKALISYSLTSQIRVTYWFMSPAVFCIDYINHVSARQVAACSRNSPTSPQRIEIKWKLVLKRDLLVPSDQSIRTAKMTVRISRDCSLQFSGKLLANLCPAYGRSITNENITLLQDLQTIKILRPLTILYFKILGGNILFTWPRNALCKTMLSRSLNAVFWLTCIKLCSSSRRSPPYPQNMMPSSPVLVLWRWKHGVRTKRL